MGEDKIEQLAEYAHSAWSGWMEYLFKNSEEKEDGTVVIPKWAVDRWLRQMKTPYANLTEDEKKSDRKEADKIISIMCENTINFSDRW